MSNFTTESAVRLRFQVEDTAWAPAALIENCIAEAHAGIGARLAPEVDPESPPDTLVRGETLLAGAVLLRALASKASAGRHPVSVGGQRIDRAKQFAALMALAAQTEEQAWRVLAPHLAPVAEKAPGDATDSAPVLGTT